MLTTTTMRQWPLLRQLQSLEDAKVQLPTTLLAAAVDDGLGCRSERSL